MGLAAVMVAAGLMTGSASAAANIEADPVEYTFLPGPYIQGLGEVANFDNRLAQTYHDVTAKRNGPDGKPLFFSAAIPGGKITPVRGTEYLKAGTYPFICTLHGAAMRGELTLDGSQGKAVRRPKVRVSIPRQKLKRVRKTGVKVRVKGVTRSKRVKVTVKKGKVLLGVKKGLSFRSGQAKKFTVRLTKAGRKALRKRRSVKVKARATVAFGKPSNASRKLR